MYQPLCKYVINNMFIIYIFFYFVNIIIIVYILFFSILGSLFDISDVDNKFFFNYYKYKNMYFKTCFYSYIYYN